MKKISSMLRRCKTLSRQLGRTSSYSSLRSKSTRDHCYQEFCRAPGSSHESHEEKEPCETVFVGSSRRRYVISSKHLKHPLLSALIEKSREQWPARDWDLSVRCEVVLFDHLLWMLENADPDIGSESSSLEELAELYVLY